MSNSPIVSIEWGTLPGQRPRAAGCNARLAIHGLEVNVPLVRLTTADGISGFGFCPAPLAPAQAQALVGLPVEELLSSTGDLAEPALPLEFALWDLVGRQQGKAVYKLLAEQAGRTLPEPEPFRVPCYDTSLYIDDLHLNSDEAAAALIASEARFGFEHHHRSFKIKVGRGARHMPLRAGTQRDIAVIRAVREAVGPEARLMIDANNGYNLNLAKQVLAESADCNLFWVEEAFHEDPVLYQDLGAWLAAEGLAVLIADGEGLASPGLMDYARDGIVQVVQYDIFNHGLANWVETGRQLDAWNVRTAPHHYGRHLGNYVTGHLAAVVDHFTYVEWDEVTTPGLDASAYRVEAGQVVIPNSPGFGLALDEDIFRQAVKAGGFIVKAG